VHQAQRRKDVLDDAELQDAPGGPALRLRFQGPFEGRSVTWLATLLALSAPGSEGSIATSPASFIEIGEENREGIPITVALPVATIDEPTIRKSMIMIRRYRRLRRGRHEYGPPGRATHQPDP